MVGKREKKADTVRYASCYIHGGDPLDTRLLHEHHKIPQGFGGSDDPGNKVWLCASCHDHVHRIGQFILSGKQGLANDLAVQVFPGSPSIRQRLHALAITAAKAMQDYTPHIGETEEEDDLVIVQLHMPRSLHNKLKTLAGSYTNKNSKRRVGLYNYILTVLRNHTQVATTVISKEVDPQTLYAAVPQVEAPPAPPQQEDSGLRDLP